VAENVPRVKGVRDPPSAVQATVWDNNRFAHGLLSRARSLLGDSFASSVSLIVCIGSGYIGVPLQHR
jgi:hypothetical protein